ncbi:MAG TPA: stage III sporulation protein AA [Bacillota bacterium]
MNDPEYKNGAMGTESISSFAAAKVLPHWAGVLNFFPPSLRQLLQAIPPDLQQQVIEIRLRINQSLELNLGQQSNWVTPQGELRSDLASGYRVSPGDIKQLLNAVTTGSFYAVEEELLGGYLALPGGHRIGVTGQAVVNCGKIRLIKNISSINFRIARSIRGIARNILPVLWKDGHLLKTLIIAPPAAGKTTLLREIIREISNGVECLQIPPLHVGLVDERSEIAGSYLGVAQLDVGPCTDILDGCSKQEGVYLLLRAMNPQVIATDEVGRETDIPVIEEIINAGVSFIATAHARNLTEAMLRPGLKRILETGSIERLIFLSSRTGVGTIESVKAGLAGPELFKGR